MADEQKLRAWIVSLVFEKGPVWVNALVSPYAEGAVGLFVHQVMRERPPAEPLIGVATLELTADWMRLALRQIETGQTEGQVVHLRSVEPKETAEPPEPPGAA